MGHGPVHWTGNFDEIQDFEHDIRNGFGGTGFMTDDEFNRTRDTAGRSQGRARAPTSTPWRPTWRRWPARPQPVPQPRRHADRRRRGRRAIFQRLGCASCHGGARLTDSARDLLHDVGTIDRARASGAGQPLTGLDTPTLKGLWHRPLPARRLGGHADGHHQPVRATATPRA